MARLFETVKGHQRWIQSLENALEENRLGSSLVFLGPSGIGKKRVAKALAQAGLCRQARRGCGQCGDCLRAEKGEHEGLFVVEPQGLQIKLEEVAPIADFLRLRLVSRSRFVLIDRADSLTPQAANSLLKVLEEPPPETHFILIASQEGGLLPTLRSRSQILRFAPLRETELRQMSDGKAWVLASSQGRMDRMEALKNPEFEKRRAEAIEAFRRSVGRDWFEARQLLTPRLKEKESALELTQVWLSVVRDGLASQIGHENLMNRDLDFAVLKDLQVPWSFLTENLLRIESEIHANVDRNLLFENLLNSWSEQT